MNNSAVTRLGDWKNVNQPIASRKWWDFRRSSGSGAVSKGVQRLRQKEGEYDPGFLYESENETRETLDPRASPDMTKGSEYPPSPSPWRSRSDTLGSRISYTPSSARSARPSDVVSYNHATPGTARWERTLWKKLEVGDIVLLKENDQIPADIIVLSTSDPEGVCFVETKNLDGETNLKPRRSCKASIAIRNEEDIEHARFWVDSEPPNANLYSYNAVLKYDVQSETVGMEHPIVEGRTLDKGGEKSEPITINELLLRGCALRNTAWVIGLVIYTGADTKIMLNQGALCEPLLRASLTLPRRDAVEAEQDREGDQL